MAKASRVLADAAQGARNDRAQNTDQMAVVTRESATRGTR